MSFYKLFIPVFLYILSTSYSQELSGYISVEGRGFPESALSSEQHGSSLSLSIKPEIYYDWDDGYQSIVFVPFFRLDQYDEARTHSDIRELFWTHAADDWELKAGIRQVFWGVTESQHLVDIINQTDFVESIDGEKKLGQPMINFSLIQDWGILDLFLLTGFRERTFPGKKGRLRFPLLIDSDAAVYQAEAEYKHIDFAARYSHTIGNIDFGLSYFYGTSREPRYLINEENQMPPQIIPVYDIIHQSGLDLQYTSDSGWLWKLESIVRRSREKQFFAFTGGFEYTFSNIDDSGLDIGLIAEYLFDDRDQRYFPPNPFNKHIFGGARLAFNDVQSTDLLAGAIVNQKTGSTFITVEGSRRLGDTMKLILEIRAFTNILDDDFFYGFRKDGHAKIELEWYY
jgi:hypothetical protein